MGLDVCGQLCRSWSYIANVNVVASLLFSWYKCAQSCKKPKRTVVIWYLTRTKGFSTRSVCYDWHRSQVVTSKALRIRRTIDGFQGRESFVVILDLVRTHNPNVATHSSSLVTKRLLRKKSSKTGRIQREFPMVFKLTIPNRR